MATTQACLTAQKNLGKPNCLIVADATKKLVFVNYYKDDGTINGIDLSTLTNGVLSSVQWNALIYDLNAANRFYVLPKLNLVTDVRADGITEDVGGGVSIPLRDGARTFEGHIIDGDPALLGNLNSWKGKTIGVFNIDKSGNLIGNGKTEGFLNPRRVEDRTLSNDLITGKDDLIQKIKVKFQISELEKDENIGMIDNTKITADISNSRGLLDIVSETTANITVTGFDVELNTVFGGVTSKFPAEGLVAADFEVFNETTQLASTFTVIENSGQTLNYSFSNIVGASSLDVLRISNKTTGTLDKGLDIETFFIAIP